MMFQTGTRDGCSVNWAIAFGAIGMSLLFAIGLGSFSLIIVGVVGAGACLHSELTLDYPITRRHAEQLYGSERVTSEQRAARTATKQADTKCLRAGRWLGLGVAALGLMEFWWQS
jgi:hypothetical protein